MSKTIQVTLESELATKYEQLSQADKDKLATVLEDLLRADQTLGSVMDEMSRKAKEAGLTEEELKRLLDE